MNISEAAKKKHEELFPMYTSKLNDTDPEFMKVLDNSLYGEIFYCGDLDTKRRMIAILASAIACKSVTIYKTMMGAALNAGVTPVEIKEVLYQSIPYVGMTKSFDFIPVTNEILINKGIKLPLEEQSTTSPGRAIKKVWRYRSLFMEI